MFKQPAFLNRVNTPLFGFLLLVITGNALAQEETKGDVKSLQRPKPGSAESKASLANPGDEDAEEEIQSSKKSQKKDEGWKPLLPKDGLKGGGTKRGGSLAHGLVLELGQGKARELYAEHPEEQRLWHDALAAWLARGGGGVAGLAAIRNRRVHSRRGAAYECSTHVP